jgi:RHS repeat-associated protein
MVQDLSYVTGVNNRLLEDNKFRYEYDLVGNRTKRTDKLTAEVTNYSWDVRDRMTGISVKNALGEEVRSAGYKYDVYNQRIAKTVDMDGAGVQAATTERYVYGGDQNIDLIFDENGNVSHRYLFGAGVDQIEADESGGSVLWALTDHLGSVRDVVDNAGVVQNHVVYDAFGGVTSQTNASVVFRYGYTARELDAESGLQYNRARYLDSFNGRFISEDLAGYSAGDNNLYRYAFNQPVNIDDPSGFAGRIRLGTFNSTSFGRAKHVSADIDYANWNYPDDKEVPDGGVVTQASLNTFSLTKNEQQGHIIPALLGGSEKTKVIPFSDNFFSQNQHINGGGYSKFGIFVERALQTMNGRWEATKQCYENGRNNGCNPCSNNAFDSSKLPRKPYITYEADLINNSSPGLPEYYFPQRPTRVDVKVTFNYPDAAKYCFTPPTDGQTVRYSFTNYLQFSGAGNFRQQPNSTVLSNASSFYFGGTTSTYGNKSPNRPVQPGCVDLSINGFTP